VSPYGPGHGDFPSAFRKQPALLRRFLDAGGRWLLVRNVDNLGARIDPLILGHHIQSQCAATCGTGAEVARGRRRLAVPTSAIPS
jgi:UDP-N-acetylglucosamine pyrophosphorylase